MAERKLFDQEFLDRLQRLGLLAKRLAAASTTAGQRRSRRRGDGLEFADHRAYAPGDDVRFLDWPYYARMERLLLRLFHEHSEGTVSILLDRSRSMALGEVCKFDYARRTAAALAYVAMVGLERVYLLPFAQTLDEGFRTGRNRGQILDVLRYLEGLWADGPTCLAGPVDQFVRRSGQAGTVICLTDGFDVEDELSGALALLRRQKDEVIFLHISDRFDSAPAILGPVRLRSSESARAMGLDGSDAILASYRQRWQEFARGVEKTCISRGAVYVRAATSAPFERLVLATLHRAGILQG